MLLPVTNIERIPKKRQRRGNRWYTCVDDGDPSFLDHHVASTYDCFVHPERLQGKAWMSGQPCLSSLAASFQKDWWITPFMHLGTVIAYVKSTSEYRLAMA
jgi:hypothetical protein